MNAEKVEMTPSDPLNDGAKSQLGPIWQHPRAV
jgi:hypothetical protein